MGKLLSFLTGKKPSETPISEPQDLSDDELRVIVRVALRYASKFPPPECEDFIMSYGQYSNWTFDAKINYMLTMMGNVLISEKSKSELQQVIENK